MEWEYNKATLDWIFQDNKGPSGQYLIEKADDTIANMTELIMNSEPDGKEYNSYIYTPTPGTRRALPEGWGPSEDEEGGRPFPHTASSDDNPPRDWTGELIAGFNRSDPRSVSQGEWEAQGIDPYGKGAGANSGYFAGKSIFVNSDAPYSLDLEKGWGVAHASAEPRPFMEPALDMTFGEGAARRLDILP